MNNKLFQPIAALVLFLGVLVVPLIALAQSVEEPPSLKETAASWQENQSVVTALQTQISALQDQLGETQTALSESETLLKASVNADRPVRAFGVDEGYAVVLVYGSDKVTLVQLE